MKKECKIVQDLLPNYLEKVTTEETNEFIKSHIDQCNECNEVYNSMQENMEIKKLETNEEINYLKKFRIKLKLLRNILILIFIIFVVIIGRKVIILSNLYNRAKEFQTPDNYYSKAIAYDNKSTRILEKYHKDTVDLYTLNLIYLSNNYDYIKYTYYDNKTEKLFIEESKDGTKVSSKDGMHIYSTVHCLNNDILDIMDCFKYIFLSSIHKVNLQDKECYLIKSGNTEMFIESSTGIIIKIIDNDLNFTTDYYYEFGAVSENNIMKPNILE